MAIPEGLISRIEKLDPLPVTAQELLHVARDEESTIAQLADVVEFDQALVAMVLRIANSAAYTGYAPVETPRDAIFRIGRNVLMTAVLTRCLWHLRTDAPLYDLTENDLWLHGAVASVGAVEIAQQSSIAVPRGAPVAALLHDVGKLIISRYRNEDFRSLLEYSRLEKVGFVEAERGVLGFDHAEVGGEMARKWNFPPDLVHAIERHHSLDIEAGWPATDVVVLANLVAKSLGVGLGAAGTNLEWDHSAARRLGIEFSGFCRACASTALNIESLRESYRFAA